MSTDYLKDDILTTTALIDKIKAETRYEDAGQGASPLFLRADNSGRFLALLILFRVERNEENKTILHIEQLITADIKDGSKIEHEPAVRFFEQLSIDIRKPFYPARKGIDKETNLKYRSSIAPTMDKLRLSALENGEVSKDAYLEYLNFALYSYSDELAQVMLAASRIFEFNHYALIKCTDCGMQYKADSSRYASGQIMQTKCPFCEHINRIEYQKNGRTLPLSKPYMMAYRTPQPSEGGVEMIEQPSSPVIDDQSSYLMDVKAQVSRDTRPGTHRLSTTQIDEDAVREDWKNNAHGTAALLPDDDYTPLPDTAAPQAVDENRNLEDFASKSETKKTIYGLGYAKRIFSIVRYMLWESPHPTPPVVLSLIGQKGQGIRTVLLYLTGYEKEQILFTDTDHVTCEMIKNSPCTVIAVGPSNTAMPWLYDALNSLKKGQSVFFTGKSESWVDFCNYNSFVDSLFILYNLNFHEYKTSELYNMFCDRLRTYGINDVELSQKEKDELMKGMDAVSVKHQAAQFYFQRIKESMSKSGGETA